MEKYISIENITKDYGSNRGNFDISFDVYQNDIVGIIGENGAGKTTLLRQIMGFVKPDSGKITILGKDAYNDSAICKKFIGYVPGEINFPDVKNGNIFLHEYGAKLGLTDFSYANSIISRLQLDITAYPKRMSKGMKQKTAIVSALMLQSPIVIMDEPTTGLDPLMRDEFLKIVEEQKERGATIIMSSNTIEEIEKVCTKVCFISKGKVIDYNSKENIEAIKIKDYNVVFDSSKDFELAKSTTDFQVIDSKIENKQIEFRIDTNKTKQFFTFLSKFKIRFLNINRYDLATYFDDKRLELLGGKND